ncbi:MAG: TonB-dependent receptor [Bacteroidota bacterium]
MKNHVINLVRLLGLLVLLLGSVALLAQKTVSGSIISEEGEPMIGVSILITGTNIGTVTDLEGNFSLSVPNDEAILNVSYTGYTPQEVLVGSQTSLKIVMEQNAELLDEVVVIGYGTVRKSDLTGSVAKISSDDFNQGAIVSADQALQGRIAGVNISQASAEPGGGINIRIRGANSITAGSDPLYVIDGFPIDNGNGLSGGGAAGIPSNGVPRNPLNTINPSDIESIEILKDASATAIYGARGANGVVLITTKSGNADRRSVNFDSYVGVSSIFRVPETLSTQEYISEMNELATARGEAPLFTDEQAAEIGEGTDWVDLVTRDAITQNHNLSFNGGLGKSRYFVSMNYLNQEGVIRRTSSERYSFRVNLDHEISDRLNFRLNLTNSTITDQNAVEGSNNTDNGPFALALIYDPTITPFRPDGNYNSSPQFTVPSPLATLERTFAEVQNNRLLGNFSLNYKLTDHLTANAKIGIDRRNGRQDLYLSQAAVAGAGNNIGGRADVIANERYSYLLQYTMNYRKRFSKDFRLNALVGTTYEDFQRRFFGAGLRDFPSDVTQTNNLGLGDIEQATIGSGFNDFALLAYFSRVNATLFEKVLLTAIVRVDGSSRFGENNKFAVFPSAAIAYKLDQEDFIPDVFSQLKFRLSWGESGNQSIGNYNSLSTYARGQNALLGGSQQQGTIATRIANPDLRWETTAQTSIALDFGLWEDRVTGTVEYFVKNTSDMLYQFPIPLSTGFGSILRNVGELRNTGLEFSFSSTNVRTNNFKWSTTFNIASIQNEVISLGGLDSIRTGNFFTETFGIITPGEELNAYYVLDQVGIFQSEEEIAASAQPNSVPGNPIYRDVNGDGQITNDDRIIAGSPWPDFTWGITNDFRYKNFGLSIFIDGQQGASLYNGNITYSLHPPVIYQNRLRDQILDRWTPDNPNAAWPNALEPSNYGPARINSRAIEDASFIRLQSVRLSYTIPNISQNFLRNATFYITGQNLAILTDYTGTNPEANRNQNSNIWAERNAYPLARTYLAGLSLQF